MMGGPLRSCKNFLPSPIFPPVQMELYWLSTHTPRTRPVGLKEAALDSPTFRAGFTHFSEQLEYLEKWLENYMKSITKLSHETGSFEGLINSFLSTVSSLPTVSEAVIDHDYTLLAMKRYGEGARDFWATTISGLKKMETNMVEPVRVFLQNDLRLFKVCACIA